MKSSAGRALRLVSGWGLVGAGVVLVPLPGPGLAVILAGLTVLSRESPWARAAVMKLKAALRRRRNEAA